MTHAVSGLYGGLVTHARLRPRRHRLGYRIFMLLLDLDELEAIDRRLSLFAVNRFALIGFRAADHGDRSGGSLRCWAEKHLAQAGLPTGGPIRILSMPRILGFGFNPLSVWFCHAPSGDLIALIYEVNNTFGERHSYLIGVAPAADGVVNQTCAKRFFVSPFMDMDLTYRFCVSPPGEEVRVGVDVHDGEGLLMATAFSGRRDTLSDRNLMRAWLAYPWMTLGSLLAIHLEALVIWLRGEKLRPRAPLPSSEVTVVATPS